MREIEPIFEFFDIAQVRARDWTVRDVAGTGNARLRKIRGTEREYKNSGNEAKKLLKTKDITFLKGAIAASFAFRFAQIER